MAVPFALTAVCFAATGSASAETGRVSAQYQGYSSAAGQDPYANDTPKDVHVNGYGGQPVVTGYIKLNLESLPSGATINGLQLALVPNSSTADNVNVAQAAIEACPLTSPLTSDGYQSNPPSASCGALHVAGEAQSDGSWRFELAPLAAKWKSGNTGLALVAYPPPNGTSVSFAPSAWSIAFDRQKTAAAVDYTPAAGESTQSEPVALGSQPNNSFLAPAVLAPIFPAPNPTPPAAAAPVATPSVATNQRATSAPVVVNQPRVQQAWIWVTAALGLAVIGLLLVGAGQQVLRGGRVNLGAALAMSRSQLATPLAVLTLAAVFALGSTTQFVGVLRFSGSSPGAGGSGGGGTAGSAGRSGAAAGTGSGGSASVNGPAGTITPGAAGSSALAGSGSGRSGSVGQNGPGVSSTTVRLGFVYQTNSQAANQAFGFKVADTGNQQSEAQAMVDYINKHGGVAGRQIQPYFVAVDISQAENDPTSGEEVCRRMTEDYHVFAVIGGGGAPDDDSANACYAQAGTINFDPFFVVPDLGTLSRESPYIWPTEVAAADRTMKWEVAGLQHQGYFSGGPAYKLGVVIAADPVNQDVYDHVTLPALHAAGVTNIDTFKVQHGTVSQVANDTKQAVAHFQLDNVNHVIFQGGGAYGGGSFAGLFMINAESQHFNPRYGLSSDDAPGALPGAGIPQDQLAGAVAVGVAPAPDTDDAHYGTWPSTPAEKKCDAIESAAGNTSSSRQAALAVVAYCNAMFELQQGAAPLTGGPLNAQLWADRVMRLGGAVYSASFYRPFVGPDHWDPAGGYRLLHAVQNCETGSQGQQTACFVYDDSNIYG